MKKTRYIAYGYTIRDGKTVIEHSEAEVIRLIFDVYIKGASLKEIAEELTRRQIPYTEKTAVWDKARIARIIENSKYMGTDNYDPIIDEVTYEEAVAAKSARQRNQIRIECDGISAIRNRVKCAKCGYPMVRRYSSRRKVSESWTCTNDECGHRVRISDSELLMKINLLINRIVENSALMIPAPQVKTQESPIVKQLKSQINEELERAQPSDRLIIDKISEIASQLYRESNAKPAIAAQIARKRVKLMSPRDSFDVDYFNELINTVTIDTNGRITLITKTDTTISEGETANGSCEDTEENGHAD